MIALDTDILIHFLRDEPRTVEGLRRLQAAGEELATTSINAAELYRGVRAAANPRRELAVVLQLLATLGEIPFGHRAAPLYGSIMRTLEQAGRPIPPVDALIAAAVLGHGASFATRNRRHFDQVEGLALVEL